MPPPLFFYISAIAIIVTRTMSTHAARYSYFISLSLFYLDALAARLYCYPCKWA